ncbi:MAG: hypothetical protein KME20_18420 [Kaiparowitsia implicata GSE-PSE-MK54-09C]|nr:hypothetical protein [Kaiparowitsia implicata GSE-PSE-MK54-09C]
MSFASTPALDVSLRLALVLQHAASVSMAIAITSETTRVHRAAMPLAACHRT